LTQSFTDHIHTALTKPGILVWGLATKKKSSVIQLLILLRPKSELSNKETDVSLITLMPDDEDKDNVQNVGHLIHSYRYG
jgi:hypothetical protein